MSDTKWLPLTKVAPALEAITSRPGLSYGFLRQAILAGEIPATKGFNGRHYCNLEAVCDALGIDMVNRS
jgi:hypothetical protein